MLFFRFLICAADIVQDSTLYTNNRAPAALDDLGGTYEPIGEDEGESEGEADLAGASMYATGCPI